MYNKISTLDIEKFRLPDSYMESCPKPPKKSRKPRLNDNFLKGPIPIAWLMKASALPGKASQIGVALWYLSGLRKNSTVILANGLLENHSKGTVQQRILDLEVVILLYSYNPVQSCGTLETFTSLSKYRSEHIS